MQTASVAVPTSTAPASSYSALVVATALDPAAPSACSLSDALGEFDVFQLWGTLDPNAVPTTVPPPPNLYPLGLVRGASQGAISYAPVGLMGYPNFAIQRIGGSAAGTFYANGGTPVNGAASSVGVSLPALGAFSAIRSLASFAGGPILVGLDSMQTINDTFAVYATNDPATTGLTGSVFIGNIQGGGGLTGTTVLVSGYNHMLCMRTGAPMGGATAGFLLAYGPNA